MAVNVHLAHESHDGSTADSAAGYVANGERFEVVDGALVVFDSIDSADGRRVALYAAGAWVSADVED